MQPDGKADVYDLAVDQHHNFALAAGVFVHNCDPVQEVCDSMTISDGTKTDRIAWVLPKWFDARRSQSEPVDSHGALSEPLTLAPGGYAIAAMVSGEKNIFAEIVEHHELGLAPWRATLKRRPSSRTMKRLAAFGVVHP